jgi:hypothetical protein
VHWTAPSSDRSIPSIDNNNEMINRQARGDRRPPTPPIDNNNEIINGGSGLHPSPETRKLETGWGLLLAARCIAGARHRRQKLARRRVPAHARNQAYEEPGAVSRRKRGAACARKPISGKPETGAQIASVYFPMRRSAIRVNCAP